MEKVSRNVRNTGFSTLNSNYASLYNEFHAGIDLADNYNLDDLVNPGWYNCYTPIDGKRYRWIIHAESSIFGGVYWRTQTAYYYYGNGSSSTTLAYIRNIYSNGSAFGFTDWKAL